MPDEIAVGQTEEFREWLLRLKDEVATARIVGRIRRMAQGNPGDAKSLGGGLMEMRIDYGPGYRLYFTYRGALAVLLLCGGDKRSQQRDIVKARELLTELKR
jgi:putative addiction module killer protein